MKKTILLSAVWLVAVVLSFVLKVQLLIVGLALLGPLAYLLAAYKQRQLDQQRLRDLRRVVPDFMGERDLFRALLTTFEELGVEKQRADGSAKFYKDILADLPQGLMLVTDDGLLRQYNAALCRILGWPQAPQIGADLNSAVRSATFLRLFEQALRTNQMSSQSVSIEIDSQEHDLQVDALPLPNNLALGQRSVLFVVHDVSKLRRLERMRSEFVANVSHELKTPITAIKGFAENILEGDCQNSDEIMRFMRIIRKQADRLHAIVEDLLVLARLEKRSEPVTEELEPVKVQDLVQRAIENCQFSAKKKEIEIETSVGAENLLVMPHTIEQALTNLVDNAIKYSGSGTSIHIESTKRDGFVGIAVSDEGRGIEAEHLPRIFERFYRVDKARSRSEGGTGLGLAIVKHAAEVHGGQCTVDSELSRGSTFTIWLPLKSACI